MDKMKKIIITMLTVMVIIIPVSLITYNNFEIVQEIYEKPLAVSCSHSIEYVYKNNGAKHVQISHCKKCGINVGGVEKNHIYKTSGKCVCGATNGNSVCSHSWQNYTSDKYLYSAATCTNSAKYYYRCKYCGTKGGTYVSGSALGHNWQAATCEKLEICRRCEITRGSKLGHDWQAATCEKPKICRRCQKIEGNALGHAQAVRYHNNGNKHVKVTYCTRCNVNLDGQEENHTFDWNNTCKYCEYTQYLQPEHKHQFSIIKSEGNYHWRECSCGEKASKQVHNYARGICQTCNDKHEKHVWVHYNSTYHQCSVCKLSHEANDFKNDGTCYTCGLECKHPNAELILGNGNDCENGGVTWVKRCYLCDNDVPYKKYTKHETNEKGIWADEDKHRYVCAHCPAVVSFNHEYDDKSVCTVCKAECKHSWKNEKCEKCKIVCSHPDIVMKYKSGKCENGGATWEGKCSTCKSTITKVYNKHKLIKHKNCKKITTEKAEYCEICEYCNEEKIRIHDFKNGCYYHPGYSVKYNYSNITAATHDKSAKCHLCVAAGNDGITTKGEKHSFVNGKCECGALNKCTFEKQVTGHTITVVNVKQRTDFEQSVYHNVEWKCDKCSIKSQIYAIQEHKIFREGKCICGYVLKCSKNNIIANHQNKISDKSYNENGEKNHKITKECGICKTSWAVTANHSYSKGQCQQCKYKHTEHNWENQECTICKLKHTSTTHNYKNKSDGKYHWSECECGYIEGKIEHSYRNGKCNSSKCNYEHKNHEWKEKGVKHECTICGLSHEADNSMGKCSECGLSCSHLKCGEPYRGSGTDCTKGEGVTWVKECSSCNKIITVATYKEHKVIENKPWGKTDKQHYKECERCGKIVYYNHKYDEFGKCVCGQEEKVELCIHNFTDATCLAPKTCTKCNATEGYALSHNESITYKVYDKTMHVKCTSCEREGCNYAEEILEEHDSKTEIIYKSTEEHTIKITCESCKETIQEKTNNHDREVIGVTSISSEKHQKTLMCKICNKKYYIHEKHKFNKQNICECRFISTFETATLQKIGFKDAKKIGNPKIDSYTVKVGETIELFEKIKLTPNNARTNLVFTIIEGKEGVITLEMYTGKIIAKKASEEGVKIRVQDTISTIYADVLIKVEENSEIKEEDKPAHTTKFEDVVEGSWYEDKVNEAVQEGLFNGTSETTFSPNTPITRGMFVTVLARMNKADVENFANVFDDVEEGKYYQESISWAVSNGVVNGIGEGKFAPDAQITREEMAVMIYNYINVFYKGLLNESAETPLFNDHENISEWAKDEVLTLKSIGLINGKSEGNYMPKDTVTRAEAAVILQRLSEKVKTDRVATIR